MLKGQSIILNSDWTTSVKITAVGNYTISANITITCIEINVSDNIIVAANEIWVTIPGDVDADFDVDIFDIVSIAGY